MKQITIILLAAGLFLAAGCAKQHGFTVTGKLKGSAKDTLLMQEMTEKSMAVLKTMITGDDGSFSYSDTASGPRLLFLQNQKKEYIMLMVAGGEKINISAENGKINETIEIAGSPQSSLILELNRDLLKTTTILDSLGKQYEGLKGHGNDPEADTWIQTEFGKLMAKEQIYIRNFIEKHPDEPASLMALSHQLGQQAVLNPRNDFDLYEKVDKNLFSKYPKSVVILNLHKYVEAMRPQVEAAKQQLKLTGVGTVAPEISLKDPDGNTRTLSSLRGKIVLLDFWAGWCAPCRRENPNLVSAYKRYHDKGFEIYQVSLDKTKPEWITAIKQDGLNWIHVSDLKYWSSPVVRLFGVESIPANFLIDKDGKILSSNLRGAALEQELSKIFN